MEDIALFIPNERYQRAAGGKEKKRKNKIGGEFGKEKKWRDKSWDRPIKCRRNPAPNLGGEKRNTC